MLAENMMIGDLVQIFPIDQVVVRDGKRVDDPMKYEDRRGHIVFIDACTNWCKVYLKDCVVMVRPHNLKPVPLTAEMLKQTGWKYNDLPMCQDWEKDGLFINENDGINRTINIGTNNSISVKFVHQLQQLLHSCGLHNQANKFSNF